MKATVSNLNPKKKIAGIKAIKTVFGLDLKEAKFIFEEAISAGIDHCTREMNPRTTSTYEMEDSFTGENELPLVKFKSNTVSRIKFDAEVFKAKKELNEKHVNFIEEQNFYYRKQYDDAYDKVGNLETEVQILKSKLSSANYELERLKSQTEVVQTIKIDDKSITIKGAHSVSFS